MKLGRAVTADCWYTLSCQIQQLLWSAVANKMTWQQTLLSGVDQWTLCAVFRAYQFSFFFWLKDRSEGILPACLHCPWTHTRATDQMVCSQSWDVLNEVATKTSHNPVCIIFILYVSPLWGIGNWSQGSLHFENNVQCNLNLHKIKSRSNQKLEAQKPFVTGAFSPYTYKPAAWELIGITEDKWYHW